ncbi:metallophosphatase [Vicingaceae bacterium]|nr:metallophosphatase [Vicingaceae bacterium]
MSRRKFIKQALFSGFGLASLNLIPFRSFAVNKKRNTKIVILHTNDVHSRIEPFPDNDPKYPGLGGAARRASLIQKIRNEEDNVLLLDAGDVFQGTPYFNVFEGEIDFKLMSMMQYDACTIGNHDFDNGIDGFNKMLPHANFPFLNTNYDFSDTILKGKIKPYKIFNKNGIKIGVFGVGVELDGLVDKKLYKGTKYSDPVISANKTAAILKNKEQCDLIICLSHLGYEYKSEKISDVKMAAQTRNIDLILGGHTHTSLDKPTKIKNLDGQITLINQVGWAGINLGRLNYFVHNSKNYTVSSQNITITGKKIP